MKRKRPAPPPPPTEVEVVVPKRRRHLSAEDEALWHAVTKTITPIERRTVPDPEQSREPLAASPSPVRSKRELTAVPAKAPPPAPRKAAATPPPATPFEAKRAKRLRRGHLDIEARLDLHGMRQAEAHRALRGFLMSAHARGLRHVKVITGKGRSSDPDDRPFDLHGPDRPGILKRLVPAWLGEADLAAVVVSFTGAGKQHGGDGAIYIHLRRSRRHSD